MVRLSIAAQQINAIRYVSTPVLGHSVNFFIGFTDQDLPKAAFNN